MSRGGSCSRWDARIARGGVAKGSATAGVPSGVRGSEGPLESLKLSEPNDDSVVRSEEESGEGGEEEMEIDARLSVTQSDDPLSGGHFAVGMSKAPLLAVRIHTRRGHSKQDSPQARQRT